MSKILDEMREIAEGNNTNATQKYLMRLLISWGLDITDEISQQSKDIKAAKLAVEQNSKDICDIKKIMEGNSVAIKSEKDKVDVIEKNIFIKAGGYIQKRPLVGIMIAVLIVLLALHSLGVEVDMRGIIEDIGEFFKIIFIA